MVLRFFLLAAVFILLSCTEAKFNNPYDPDSPNWFGNSSSSAETVPGSSSSKPSSSSSMPAQTTVIYGPSENYHGETYQTVLIGSQVWFKRNLNYAAPGSRCYGEGVEGVSADSVAKNCKTYGRLYDWATAMGIDAKYNSEWWDIDEEKVNEKHQGICPSGWHIPSDAEWTTLTDYVGDAGTKLKATSGWVNVRGKPEGNGEDVFGFSALPGGTSTSGFFGNVGCCGLWWTATENLRASFARTRNMYYDNATVISDNYDKSFLYSVRCVKD